jgi:tripartite-type tricarboxylate transporter receptor subunit TctC
VLPDLPTVAEAGVPNFEVIFWTTLFAPAGLPPALLAKVHSESQKALERPELRAAMAKVSENPSGTSVDGAAGFVKAEYVKWAQVVKDANLHGE